MNALMDTNEEKTQTTEVMPSWCLDFKKIK